MALNGLDLQVFNNQTLDATTCGHINMLEIQYNPLLLAIGAGALDGLSSLRFLDVNNNPKLSSIAAQAFVVANQSHNSCLAATLQEIYLTSNPSLTTLSGFEGLAVVSTLHVINNSALRSIQVGDLSGLGSLINLHITDNPSMSSLAPGAFAELGSLHTLHISGNRELRTILDGTFKGLRSVKTFRLEDNGLVTLEPGAFTGMTAATDLQLSRNSALEVLEPAVFAGLDKLQFLNLSYNTALKNLSSGAFQGLAQLLQLHLSATSVTQIGIGTWDGLPKLTTLDISDNQQLMSVGSLLPLGSLVVLLLDSTGLSRIDTDMLDGLHHLQVLQISTMNSLEYVSPQALHGLPSLVQLKMSALQNLFNYQFAYVTPGSAHALAEMIGNLSNSVQLLDFSWNPYGKLEFWTNAWHAAGQLQNLKTLNLAHSSVEVIPRDFFANLSRLEKIVMTGNPTICSVNESTPSGFSCVCNYIYGGVYNENTGKRMPGGKLGCCLCPAGQFSSFGTQPSHFCMHT